MKISGLFYGLQGEGPTAGVPTVFLQVPETNLSHKGGWNSKIAMENTIDMSYTDIQGWMADEGILPNILYGTAHFVLTGGEPFFQKYVDPLWRLLEFIRPGFVEIETNGTVRDHALWTKANQINCNLLLSNSGVPYKERIIPRVLEMYAHDSRVFFKFTICEEKDIDEVKSFQRKYGVPTSRIYLTHPVICDNVNKDTVGKLCGETCFRYSPKLQFEIFGCKTSESDV